MKNVISVVLELGYAILHARRVPKVGPEDDVTLCSLLDAQVAAQPDAVMLIEDERTITWSEFQALGHSIANLLLARGVKAGQSVAVNMENSILYLACLFGITRIGAVAALINTNVTGRQLVHCVGEVGAVLSLVDRRASNAIADCHGDYQDATQSGAQIYVFGAGKDPLRPYEIDGDAALADASSSLTANRRAAVLSDDPALYIFTSGTTGLPKAAITTHLKFFKGASGMAVFGFHAKSKDRLYNCLPLYHGTGLILGFGAALYSGASMYLRKGFSASKLLDEVRQHGCTMMIYVGEICRYLLNTPEREGDARSPLERIAGNGLRPEIWMAFKKRFGIKRIAEFYGASESNGGFTNLLNRDKTIGMTSSTVKLVTCSLETAEAIRGEDGLLSEVPKGESGLLLIEVNETDQYDGYLNAEASEKKLIRDAFETGDCYFNSGDVIRQVDVGFAFGIPHYQFVDRLGDTFRWKSENVSANEVAAILAECDTVSEAVVYGVEMPGHDGKAGMATIVLEDGAPSVDADALSAFTSDRLPKYAIPLFVRTTAALEKTGTHKFVKTQLVAEGFDLDRIGDPMLAWDPRQQRYVPLEADLLAQIRAGNLAY